MPYTITTATRKIAALKKRIKIIQGGTSAGKTIGINQVLIDKAQRDTEPTITSIVSESFPHLKRGAMRDFVDILEQHKYFVPDRWNKTDSTYTFETNSQIEFFSADQPSKVRGPRRRRLFINEANHLPFETFEQLEVRTLEDIYIDYNPTTAFWVHEHIIGKRDDYDFVILTYKDNEALSAEIVKSIEQRRNRKDWWRVYGEGQLGEIEGTIYSGWKTIDEIPHEARLERRWLDFGYTNDPSAIGDLYSYNGGYILDEHVYQKGLSNKQLSDILLNLPFPQTLVIADSAEPKSIAEIKSFGLNIIPAVKGKDSVVHGVQIVQDQQISVTKRSINIIKEQRNYLWLIDREGRVLNVEDPMCANHHMSGIRYAITSLVPIKRRQEYINSLPQFPNKKPINPAL